MKTCRANIADDGKWRDTYAALPNSEKWLPGFAWVFNNPALHQANEFLYGFVGSVISLGLNLDRLKTELSQSQFELVKEYVLPLLKGIIEPVEAP